MLIRKSNIIHFTLYLLSVCMSHKGLLYRTRPPLGGVREGMV